MSCTHEDKPAPKKDKSKYDVQVLLAVGEIMPKEALISKAQALPMGLNKAKGFISELVSDGIFRVIEKPRSRTNPELHLERLI